MTDSRYTVQTIDQDKHNKNGLEMVLSMKKKTRNAVELSEELNIAIMRLVEAECKLCQNKECNLDRH